MNPWGFRLALFVIIAFSAGWGFGARYQAAAASDELAALQRFLMIQSLPSGQPSPALQAPALPPGALRTLPPGHPPVPGYEAPAADQGVCPHQDWARRFGEPRERPREVVEAPRTAPRVITT